jgi:hypothetical protein
MSIDDAKPEEWDRASASLNAPDPVEKPAHYRVGEVECIDYIQQQLGSGVKDYLRGQVYKYMHRHQYKGAEVEDLRKARWYIDRLIYELVQEDL